MDELRSARSRRMTLTEAAHLELHEAIVDGLFSEGSQLPTEAELGEMLGVSRTTVRAALRSLEEEGFIVRRHGVGTFVRQKPLFKNLNFNFGITDMAASAGIEAGTSFLEADMEPAGEDGAEQLQVLVGSPVFTIRRVRTADGRPIVYSTEMLPEHVIRAKSFDPQRLYHTSLYKIVQYDLGFPFDYGVAQILPALPPPEVAAELQISTQTPLLYILQTNYSADDEPILYEKEYHLPDAFDFIVWRRGPHKLKGVPPKFIGDA
jgi:DNA-binding GntR family transcriptional regulator